MSWWALSSGNIKTGKKIGPLPKERLIFSAQIKWFVQGVRIFAILPGMASI